MALGDTIAETWTFGTEKSEVFDVKKVLVYTPRMPRRKEKPQSVVDEISAASRLIKDRFVSQERLGRFVYPEDFKVGDKFATAYKVDNKIVDEDTFVVFEVVFVPNNEYPMVRYPSGKIKPFTLGRAREIKPKK